MEVKLKEKLQRNRLRGMVKDAEAIYQRITKKTPVKTSRVAVASSTPYEISEACRTHQLEGERKRSHGARAARRQTFRAR